MFVKSIRSHFAAVPGARRFDGNLKEKEEELCSITRWNESRLPLFTTKRELSKERKELILKLISGLLDGVDNSVLAGEIAPVPFDVEEPLESRLEERAVYNRLSQLPQRDRKAPCKNFFWKTFTSC
uniref:Cortistatin n=1 Tax=Sinocyclocheilus grahami TaxID=75366 RepID=A0A672S0F5_SINGR